MIYKVLVTNTLSPFDWLTFLIGGALGAALILGLERLLDWRKSTSQKRQISLAMDLEIDDNLKLCKSIISKVSTDVNKFYAYPRFSADWMDKYIEICVDYTNEDSTRLQSFIYGAKSLVQQIHSIQEMLSMTYATGQALHHLTNHIFIYNQSMMERAVELAAVLSNMRLLRKNNKIYKDDVFTLLKPSQQVDIKTD